MNSLRILGLSVLMIASTQAVASNGESPCPKSFVDGGWELSDLKNPHSQAVKKVDGLTFHSPYVNIMAAASYLSEMTGIVGRGGGITYVLDKFDQPSNRCFYAAKDNKKLKIIGSLDR
tara:strand:+ start:249 stop:602 length:354 start_codon:yes stop_codon:yes gene_type:complete